MASLRELFDLSGQTALITGGSRGLGLQFCEALGEFGAKLFITARKDAELASAVSHLNGLGIDATAIRADLSARDAPAFVVDQTLKSAGRLDILVNNAGAAWAAPSEEHPIEQWDKVLALNLTATFLLSQEAARRSMIPRRSGRILNIASVKAFRADRPEMPKTVSYDVTKSALVGMTRSLAAEWGHYGITVNALSPGYFPSKLSGHTISRHEAALIAGTPLGRLGGADDLKGAALLLVSAAGAHITGQSVIVDGGASL